MVDSKCGQYATLSSSGSPSSFIFTLPDTSNSIHTYFLMKDSKKPFLMTLQGNAHKAFLFRTLTAIATDQGNNTFSCLPLRCKPSQDFRPISSSAHSDMKPQSWAGESSTLALWKWMRQVLLWNNWTKHTDQHRKLWLWHLYLLEWGKTSACTTTYIQHL